MNRRGFFAFLGGAAVAAALAPELIWTPSRTIFLPPAGGWTVNQLGDYLYAKELSEILRRSVQPLVRFKQFEGERLIMYGPPGMYIEVAA